MNTQPLPTLAELGPLSDREWRIYALGLAAGHDDGYDRGFAAGVQVLVDDDRPVAPRPRHLRLVAS